MTSPDSAQGLTSEEAARLLATVGPNAVPPERRHPLLQLLKRFWGPVPWLVETALLVELLLRQLPQALTLLVLLAFNAAVGWFHEGRAQQALELLTTRLVSTARVLRDGSWQVLPATQLVPGDLAHLRAGDTVPADVELTQGELLIDQSSITGESVPVEARLGAEAFSGSVVLRGEADIRVKATGRNTRMGQATVAVAQSGERSQMASVVLRIVRVLGGVVVLLAAVAFLVGYFAYGIAVSSLVSFCVALLVSSIPAALPAAFALSAALGSRDLSARGVLVTRLSAIEDAASLDIFCSDKTGTLTSNRLSVSEVVALGCASREDVLEAAALASDAATQDPLDMAVLAVGPKTSEGTRRLSFIGFDPATRRSEAVVLRDGKRLRVMKGAPETLAALTGRDERSEVTKIAATGARVLAVATGEDQGSLELIGLVGFADPPRQDSKDLIQHLHALGVRVIMLTGDTPETARSVAAMVGIPGKVCLVEGKAPGTVAECGAFAQVYPEDKVRIVAGLQDQAHVVGMTGDGVNDAPALRRADLGIAVATATDAAKAAASAVLTDPGLRNVVATVEEGRRIYQRILTYTLNKIIKTFHIALFLVAGLLLTGDFLTAPSLLLIVLLANDFATLSIATDRAEYSARPDRWTVGPLAAASLALAAGWVAFSLSAYFVLRAVWDLPLGEMQTLSFLLLVLSGQLTVLLVRTRGWAWRSRPGTSLILSMVIVSIVATGVALTGALVSAPPLAAVLALEAGIGVFALALDAWKVLVFRALQIR